MNYAHRSPSPRRVQPRGILFSRLRLSLDRLIGERKMHTAYAGWGADQIGRWIGATILEAALLDDAASLPMIRSKVDELVAAQDSEGFYYGSGLRATPKRLRECWFGHGRGIWNLMEYHGATADKAALASVLRAADLAVATRDAWEISKPLCGGIESIVGPMARLGQITGNQEYVEYARYMADNIQRQVARPSPIPTAHVDPTSLHTHEERPLFHHTHSYLNTAHGIVDLAVVTGEQKYVDQAKRVFEDSLSSVWLNGAFPESYGDYYERIDETCSTVDWIVLGLKLFALTGEFRYLDSVELSAMNQLMFGQDHRGTFTCYRSLNRQHWADEKNRGCAQNECCAMSGGWGLAQVAMHTITETDAGLSINLPFEAQAIFERDGGEVRATQTIWTYSRELVQTIRVENSSRNGIDVQVRVPYWCIGPSLRVNGQSSSSHAHEGWLVVACPNGSDSSIEVRLPMRLVIIPPRRNGLSEDRQYAAGNAVEQGLQFGPYVLMFNREMVPELKPRDIHLTVNLDAGGEPYVRHEYPTGWPVQYGAVPLFVEAAVQDGAPVLLTPCANMAMTAITMDDPYIMRFAGIEIDYYGGVPIA